MPRRTKEEANKTRSRILASALSLFVKKGYENATFTDIAARLKMTKGVVYWHFESKEQLLIALVDEMLAKFRRQMDELMATTSLTFPAVAEMMIQNALRTASDSKKAAFFLLLQTQIKWRDDSMAQARADFLSGKTSGPYHAFIQAIENDKREGRVRPEVDATELASACMAAWDGLVRSKLEKFLVCDMETTLRHLYEGIWQAIRIR